MALPKKISQLPSVVTIKNADLFAIVQDGVTSNVTFAVLESVISGYTASADTYVTGGVYNSGTTSIDFTGNTDFPPFSVDVSSLLFTGNTSGDCITDLYITNLYGCSPITIHDNIQSVGSSATGTTSFAFGNNTKAYGDYSHAEGSNTMAIGRSSHAEGGYIGLGSATIASGDFSHAEGKGSVASEESSHAEGSNTLASGNISHAEGSNTIASGLASHAEGSNTIASGLRSHAEGQSTEASGENSHAQGVNTIASGDYSHAGGVGNNSTNRVIASGETSFIHFRQTSNSGNIGAYGDYSAILGGNDHNIGSGSTSSGIFAGESNIIDNTSDATIIGGTDGLISGSTTSYPNTSQASVIIGGLGIGANNKYILESAASTLIGGLRSKIEYNDWCTVIGGQYGKITNSYIIEMGGLSSEMNFIAGGITNIIDGGRFDSIVGGGSNIIKYNVTYSGFSSGNFIGGGDGNTIDGHSNSVILGGTDNTIDFDGVSNNAIISGYENRISGGGFDGIFVGSGNTIEGNPFLNNDISNTMIGGSNNTIYSGRSSSIIGGEDNILYNDTTTFIENSVILGGNNLTGTTNNTVYVPNLNIGTIGTGTSTNNLGIDISGNVVTGATGGGTFTGNTSGDCITDLYITNLYGCSPITINDNLQHISSSATGINSIAWGTGTTASGIYSHAEGRFTIASGETSHAEGLSTTAGGDHSHAEGYSTTASGVDSHAEGYKTIASGFRSHAEGWATTAIGNDSHAEGKFTIASGFRSHAEGDSTSATTNSSHAEGYGTLASGNQSHAEGYGSIASGDSSHAGGSSFNLTNDRIVAIGKTSFVHFKQTYPSNNPDPIFICSGYTSQGPALGVDLYANGYFPGGPNSFILFGVQTGDTVTVPISGSVYTVSSVVDYSKLVLTPNPTPISPTFDLAGVYFEVWRYPTPLTMGAHGDYSAILGGNDHIIGTGSTSSGIFAGSGNTINDDVLRSVVIGGNNIIGTTDDTVYVPNLNIGTVGGGASVNNLGIDISGNVVTGTTGGGTFTGNTSGDCITDLYITNLYGCSPITVNDNLQHISSSATGVNSTAWGTGTTSSGDFSHAEGKGTIASGDFSHAEGENTESYGDNSHAEGYLTVASGINSHSEGGYAYAIGDYSHAEGGFTKAIGNYSHSEGFNTIASGDHSHSGGKGRNSVNRIIASGDTSFVHFKQTFAGIIGAFGDYSVILGGNDHNIGTGSTSSGIFAGSDNIINDNVLRSVVIGGQNIIGTTDDTVYVPNLNINNLIMANDDIDAGLSGLTTGDIYQTSGNGGAPLNEIGLLMIKQ